MFIDMQGISIEDIPKEYKTKEFYEKLPYNGANAVYVTTDTPLGKWLAKNGFSFLWEDSGICVMFR